jgi:hypothetical protein
MEPLEDYRQNERIIDDFTSVTLAAIPSDYGRLIHLAMLRDIASGAYRHEGLEAVYPAAAVSPALSFCHEEIFQKILETPLERQEWDLRKCLSEMNGDVGGIAARWNDLEFYRLLIPSGTPDYMRDLFTSNLRILLEIVMAEASSAPSTA